MQRVAQNLSDMQWGAPLTAQENIMQIGNSEVTLDFVVADGTPDNQIRVNDKVFTLTAIWNEDGKSYAHYTSVKPEAGDIDDETEDVNLLTVSVAQAAKIADVTVQSVRDVLRNEARRKEVFPSAFRFGTMERGGWRLRRSEVEAWQPRRVKFDDGE